MDVTSLAASAPALAFRLGDLARIAEAPTETIRSRLRAGLLGDRAAGGWRRFSAADAARVALHSLTKAETGDDALAAALLAEIGPRIDTALAGLSPGDGEALLDAMAADLFAVAVRDPAGGWQIEVAEGPYDTDAAIARRTAETFTAHRFFLVLNLGATLRQIAARIMLTPAAVAAAAPAEPLTRSRRHAG